MDVVLTVPLMFAVTSLEVVIEPDGTIPEHCVAVAIQCEDRHGRSFGPEDFNDVPWSPELGGAFRYLPSSQFHEQKGIELVFSMKKPAQVLNLFISDIGASASGATKLPIRTVFWAVGTDGIYSNGVWRIGELP